jgi:hypothetical protein
MPKADKAPAERSKRHRKLPKKYEIEEESTEEQNKRLRKEQRSTKSGNDLHSRGYTLVGCETEVLFTATWPAKGRWAKVQVTAFDPARDTFVVWLLDENQEERGFSFKGRACRDTVEHAFKVKPTRGGASRDIKVETSISPDVSMVESYELADGELVADIKSKNFVEKLTHMLESSPGKFDGIIEWSVCGRLLVLVNVSTVPSSSFLF